MSSITTDVLVIGGGINGTGIAADAAGRGLNTILCEQYDLADTTSAPANKLYHGDFHCLEHLEIDSVLSTLEEQETLLNRAPHLIHSTDFVIPHNSKQRTAWLMRITLFLHDHFCKNSPKSNTIKLEQHHYGKALKSIYKKAYTYKDSIGNDSRLVIANALLAKQKGADIRTHEKVIAITRAEDGWHITTEHQHSKLQHHFTATALVNATGPWINEFIKEKLSTDTRCRGRLIKQSHIVLPKLYDGKQVYLLQRPSGRIIYTTPYCNNFTLVGSTDNPLSKRPKTLNVTNDEKTTLLQAINEYFETLYTDNDIVSSYSELRTFYDDDTSASSKNNVDYLLDFDCRDGYAPLVNVFGGHMSTYRRLSEQCLEMLEPYFNKMGHAWTKDCSLPGGDIIGQQFPAFIEELQTAFKWLPLAMIKRYAKVYGSECYKLLKHCNDFPDLGKHFGHSLYQQEVQHLINNEWALSADDILWRRTQLGLLFTKTETRQLQEWITIHHHVALAPMPQIRHKKHSNYADQ